MVAGTEFIFGSEGDTQLYVFVVIVLDPKNYNCAEAKPTQGTVHRADRASR